MSGKTIGDLIREQLDVRNADDDVVLAHKIQEAQEEIYGIEAMNSADLLHELRRRGITVELERPPVLEEDPLDDDVHRSYASLFISKDPTLEVDPLKAMANSTRHALTLEKTGEDRTGQSSARLKDREWDNTPAAKSQVFGTDKNKG